MTFALPAARMNEGLSIRALSKEVGVHQHAIRRLENGEGGVLPATAKKIADRFDVKVTDILPPVAA